MFSPASWGTNHLIQEGAKLVCHSSDILEQLNLSMVAHQLEMKEITAPVTDTEVHLLTCLSRQATHIDDVCRHSGLPVATVTSTLAMLGFKRLAKQVGRMNYVLA